MGMEAQSKTNYMKTVGIPAAFYPRKSMIPAELKCFPYSPLSKDFVED